MNKLKALFRSLGPGFITGASDDDPSGIATYSQTGAHFGFGFAWTALFTFPLMAAVQEMCGKIGLITGKGLAGVIKQHYAAPVLYIAVCLLFVANTVNIGADLGAMAESAELVSGFSFSFWLVVMVVVTLLLQIAIPYKQYASYLKYLTFVLFAYIITAFVVTINWQAVLVATIVPSIQFSREYLLNIVAILGTTISPYLFFWQASEEVEEEVAAKKIHQMGAGLPRVTSRDLSVLHMDTMFGMFFSNLVMWFIIVVTGATLYTNGITNIRTAADAAKALQPIAGDAASLLFALGIIGTGLLAVPILAGSASYAIGEALGWNVGLSKRFGKAEGFYSIIILSTLVGMGMNGISEIDPIQALYYTAVLNGIIAPPLLILIFLISNNKRIMGERVNSLTLNILGGITIIIMSLAAIALLVSFVL